MGRENGIDAFRRNLQHAYLEELVGTKINGPFPTAPPGVTPQQAAVFVSPPDGGARPVAKSELIALDAQLRDAIPRAGDPDTRIHMVICTPPDRCDSPIQTNNSFGSSAQCSYRIFRLPAWCSTAGSSSAIFAA